MQTVPGKRTALLTVSLVLSACGGGGGGGGTVPAATTIPTFTQWSNVAAGSTVKINGSGQQVSGTRDTNGIFTDVSLTAAESESYSATLTFGPNRELTRLLVLTPSSTSVVLDKTAGDGFTDLTLAAGPSQFVGAVSPTTGNVAIMANPINLGWEYQTFGVWEAVGTNGGRTFGAMSVGNNSPTAIPGTDTAIFTGYATGSYVGADGKGTTALAELTVGVNFGTQSLDFSTTNTQTSADFTNLVDTPFAPKGDLDLTGTLTYAPGTNSFTGPVSSAGGLTGTSTGQFYGPSAEELGGVFFLKNPAAPLSAETYAGAYGAAR